MYRKQPLVVFRLNVAHPSFLHLARNDINFLTLHSNGMQVLRQIDKLLHSEEAHTLDDCIAVASIAIQPVTYRAGRNAAFFVDLDLMGCGAIWNNLSWSNERSFETMAGVSSVG